ncbi:serine protease [Streptomyces sp. 71268]|uniref:serine protease n=1 Tax=Streptomyces sp. 71268 TaxID=3002640 RepID=UPI0023F9D8B9|nr:serine protease [Streptomyces sp. 71268]WEV26294.1 serine protease [Streptomyces sp. 71268]
MTTSPLPRSPRMPRRTALRSLAVAATVIASTLPAWNASASGTQSAGSPAAGRTSTTAEQPTYTLTIHHIGRDGRASQFYKTILTEFAGEGERHGFEPEGDTGTTTVRLPKGRYLLASMVWSGKSEEGTDWVVQPRLDLDRDLSVTVDARTTKLVDVRPPDSTADFRLGNMGLSAEYDGVVRETNMAIATPTLRVAHLGPAAEPGSIRQWYDAYWTTKRHSYALGNVVTGDRALNGLFRRPAAKDLGEIKIRGAARPGTEGTSVLDITPSNDLSTAYPLPTPTPGTTSLLVEPERGPYDIGYTTPRDEEGQGGVTYQAKRVTTSRGHTTTRTFNNAVFGPSLPGGSGVTRDGNRLTVDVPLLTDGEGNVPSTPEYDTARVTLYRNGTRVKTVTGEPGQATFDVPADRATYRVTATVRQAGTAATTVTASWTFASQRTSGEVAVPVSAVRFTPTLDLTGAAPAGTALRVPVAVQGAAKGHTRALDVAFSVNGGTTWQRASVVRGVATIPAFPSGTGVSLRAKLTDTAGNTLIQTAIGAYRTR